jgi:hypothetical protein
LTQIRKGRKNRGRAGLARCSKQQKKKGLRLVATTLDVLLVPRAGILKIPMQAVNKKLYFPSKHFFRIIVSQEIMQDKVNFLTESL